MERLSDMQSGLKNELLAIMGVQNVLKGYKITRRRGETPSAAVRRAAKGSVWDAASTSHALRAVEAADSERARALERFAAVAEEALGKRVYLNALLAWLGERQVGDPLLSITKARAALQRVHINLFDLLGGNDKRHGSVQELADYTFEHGLVFPKRLAKGMGLRDFLRHLH